MKKVNLFLMAILLSFIANSQETGSLKAVLEPMLSDDGSGIITVTNKQSCTAHIKIVVGTFVEWKDIASLASDTFHVKGTGTATITTLTNCGSADLTPIVIPFSILVTPIHFSFFEVKRISASSFKVTFTCNDLSNEDHFNIQVSLDGQTWQTVRVVLPSDVQLNKPYSTIINLK